MRCGKSRDFPKRGPQVSKLDCFGAFPLVWPLLVRGLQGLMAGLTRFSACLTGC